MFDQIQKLDEEIEKLRKEKQEFMSKVKDTAEALKYDQEYSEKVEALEKEKDDIYKKMAEETFERMQLKEERFKALTFAEDTDEYYLMNCVATGQFGCFYTDDFGYGDWQKEVPDGWDLDRYFNAMNNLEELFMHLAHFQKDISGYFPEQQLIIQWPTGVYVGMRFIVGQGSDFSIWLPTSKEMPEIEFALTWEEAVRLCKVKSYEKAKWYVEEKLKASELSVEEKQKLYYKLGANVSSRAFFEIVNAKNLREVLDA